jgi:nucleoside-diphosphate-sugar epimerase
MKLESVLVTGSDGYIGENLVRFLESKGVFKIYKIDKKSGVRLEDVDVILRCDLIVHLAAESGIPKCEEDPKEAILSNISASFNILNLAYKNNIPVILASSQAAKNPSSSLYASTKYAMEIEALRLNDKGANNKILRFSNVFGGYKYIEKKNSVLACFAKAFLNGEELKIHGSGKQERDFIHVDDLCKVIFQIGSQIDKIKESIIDVGTGYPISIISIVDYLRLDYEYSNERDGGETCNFADTSFLEKYGFDVPSISKLYEFLNTLQK